MKKRSMKFCAALLSVLMFVSMPWSSAMATEFNKADNNVDTIFSVKEDENGIRFIGPTGDDTLAYEEISDTSEKIETVDDYFNATGKRKIYNKSSILLKSTNSLPESVDNSTSKYFPEINSQGGLGSCVLWAQTYYQYTYTFNKYMDITTTPENTFSPKFTYNMLNGGNGDNGATADDGYRVMKELGNVTLSQVPYDEDPTSWSPYEELWRDAIRYRIKDYQYFSSVGDEGKEITSPDDEDLQAMKMALSNGEVLTFSTFISSWVLGTLKSYGDTYENNKYYGQYVVKSQDGTAGGHRMTIVGYNDNIWTDINDNFVVDKGEMGAFKIANSWGKDYANDGFIWIAYDALNTESCVKGAPDFGYRQNPIDEVARIEVMPYNYKSDLYLKYTLNSSCRGSVTPYLVAEKDGTVKTAYTFAKSMTGLLDGDDMSFDGTQESNDGTMICPLSSLIPEISSENLYDYTFSVEFSDDIEDGKLLTVKDAQIVDESTNTVYKPEEEYPIQLDGSSVTLNMIKSTTNHSVVYYRGYEDIKMVYKLGDDEWKTVDMEENTEREGYVHKYVVDLMDKDEITLYFKDDKGNVDDNNGNYYTAVKGLNYFATPNARKPLEARVSYEDSEYYDTYAAVRFFSEGKGGYLPYSYQFEIEDMTTGEIVTSPFSDADYCLHYPTSAGSHRITLYIKDQSGAVATDTTYFYLEDKPFAFKSFDINFSKNVFVDEEINFTAKTIYEGIKYYGYLANTYDVSIEKEGKVLYSETISPDECDFVKKSCLINFSWTPSEAGSYIAKISSTDANDEYAETYLTFDVTDITLKDTPKGMHAELVTKSLDITVRGDTIDLMSFSADDIIVSVSAANLQAGSVTAVDAVIEIKGKTGIIAIGTYSVKVSVAAN